jgi:hypothetical protein
MDLGNAESTIEDEAGPEILDHKYPLIVPSGSFDKLPSSEILSTGKTIIVSLPAFAIGGLLIMRQVVHSEFLRHEKKSAVASMHVESVNSILFIILHCFI